MFRHFIWQLRVHRIGPDLPLTHFLMYHPSTARWLCRRKFRSFGNGAAMRPYAYAICTNRIDIGSNVVIRSDCMFFAGEEDGGDIIIENDVIIGSGVHIYCDNHRFDDPSQPIGQQGFVPTQAVYIRQGAWIGARAILLPGVTIGRNAVVGAGAVVTKDVPDHTLAVGVPARIVRRAHDVSEKPS